MASTVGQVIQNARQVVPDMAQTLPPAVATATVVTATGSTLPAGSYNVVVTQINPYGETLPSTEITGLAVGANQGIQVTSALQPSVVKIRVYLTMPGGAAGTEQQYIESFASPFTIAVPPTNAGTPPQLSRAFLPDTDGGLIGAFAIFGWLNDGLRVISREAGGLLDYSGLGSISNTPLYTMPGEWNEITSTWYDGYWMTGGDRGYFFRRNNITSSILSSYQISVYNNQMVLEVYPQPSRSAAATTLAVGMLAIDSIAQLTSIAGFLLPFGFVKIDSEIMAYNAISGGNLINLIRGLGGSPAVAHNIGAPVQELNIFWNGKRQIEPNYQPGQSASLLPLPSGWDVLLAQYVAGRAKNIEHDGQYWKALMDDIQAAVRDWARNAKGIAKRRQVGPPSAPGVFYPNQAGGILVNVLTSPVLLMLAMAGGFPSWLKLLFMFCAILELTTCVMWGKRHTKALAGMSTFVIQQEQQKENGFWNCAASACNLCSTFWNKLQKKTAMSVKRFGWPITNQPNFYSTLIPADCETQTTQPWLKNFADKNAIQKLLERFGKRAVKMEQTSNRKQEKKKSEKRIGFNFSTLKSAQDTQKQ